MLIVLLSMHERVRLADLQASLAVCYNSVRRRAERLHRMGLITTGILCTVHWISLNAEHPLYAEVRAVAQRLADLYHWPKLALRTPEPRRTWRCYPEERPWLTLFGHVRAEILITVSAVGSCNIRQLSHLIGRHYPSVYESLAQLETMGLIRTKRNGKNRTVSLNPRFCAASELRGLLTRIRELDGSYDALARSFNAAPCTRPAVCRRKAIPADTRST